MSKNFYSEIHFHIVWHTKDSLPLLTADVELLAHREIRHKIVAMPGIFVHAIGGTETHVHIAVTVPPTLTPSEFVGQLKGASSHEVNQQLKLRGNVLQWQAGYGIVTFGSGHLEWVKQYIGSQREHHAKGTISQRLERFTAVEDSPEKQESRERD